jgi:hypothetical protein
MRDSAKPHWLRAYGAAIPVKFASSKHNTCSIEIVLNGRLSFAALLEWKSVAGTNLALYAPVLPVFVQASSS